MGLQIAVLPSNYSANGTRRASRNVQSQWRQFLGENSWAFNKSNAFLVFLLLHKHQWHSCNFVIFFLFSESWIERCLNESENKRYSSHTSLGNVSNDESKCLTRSVAGCPRHGPHPAGRNSTPVVLGWGEFPRNQRLWRRFHTQALPVLF